MLCWDYGEVRRRAGAALLLCVLCCGADLHARAPACMRVNIYGSLGTAATSSARIEITSLVLRESKATEKQSHLDGSC